MPSLLARFMQLLAIAAAYAAFGWLALFLAIPPGFAVPIWPSAAIALAAVLRLNGSASSLAGILLGSFAINLHIAQAAALPLADAALTSVLIATGASVQAAFGGWLVLRFKCRPRRLQNLKRLCLFLALGGPVACAINAIASPLALWALGALPAEKLPLNMATWWVGDVLGVFCLAPLIFLLTAKPHIISYERKTIVGAIQLTAFAVTIGAIAQLKEFDRRRLEFAFTSAAETVAHELEERLRSQGRALESVAAFVEAAAGEASPDALASFTQGLLRNDPALLRLDWLPLASDAALALSAKDTSGELTRHAASSGSDSLSIGAYPTQARHPGAQTLTLYCPVHKREQLASSSEAFPQQRLLGYALGEIDLASLVKGALESSIHSEIALEALIMQEDKPPVVTRSSSWVEAETRIGSSSPLQTHQSIAFAGQRWHLRLVETGSSGSLDSWSIWASLVSGCLFTSVLGLFLMATTGQNATIRRMVEKKTQLIERKKRELERNNRNLAVLAAEAQVASRAKSEFLATISHEIRTPMNGMIGVLHLLEDELEEPKRKLLGVAQRSADALLAILNDLLDFSKIEAGQMTLEQSEFSILEMAEDTAALYANQIHQKGLALYCIVPPEADRFACGDPNRVRQIVSNLLGNAMKFTQEGEITLAADIDWSSSEPRLTFTVTDTGIGIEEEKLAGIFESFTQADSSATRKFGGTGLGLAICKRLSQLMGGDIELRSVLGIGTSVRISLPFRAANERRQIRPTYQPRRVRIEIENEAFARNLGRWYRTWGCQVDTSEQLGLAERNLFERADHDMVIADRLSALDSFPPDQRPRLILFDRKLSPTSKSAGPFVSSRIPAPGRIASFQAEILEKRTSTGGAERRPRPGDAKPQLSAIEVLLVDDNQANQFIASAILQQNFGIKPVMVGDGLAALEAMRRQRFDIVFMDCMMPQMDGFEATQAIRGGETGESNKSIPIIALTANATDADRDACLKAGMNDYLSKPMQPQKLREKLTQWARCPSR